MTLPSSLVFLFAMVWVAVGCTPTVKVATDEPITINLNVNIKHEILVKVDKQLRTAYVTEAKNQRLVQFRVDRPGLAWKRWERLAKP